MNFVVSLSSQSFLITQNLKPQEIFLYQKLKMKYIAILYSVSLGIFMISTLSLVTVNSLPVASIHNSNRHAVEISLRKSVQNIETTEKSKVRNNFVQSSEEDRDLFSHEKYSDPTLNRVNEQEPNIWEDEEAEVPDLVSFPSGVPNGQDKEKKNNLSKFYQNGERSVSLTDSIIFPMTKQEDSLKSPETPTLRNSVVSYNQRMRFLESPEPEYHHPLVIIKLLSTLLFKPAPIENQETNFPSIQFSQDISNLTDEPIIIIDTAEYDQKTTPSPVEDVNGDSLLEDLQWKSLYSGPKSKGSCPPGQHRTYSGHCQEKSRKLGSSSR